MPKAKPCPKTQLRIVDHLKAGNDLVVCVSLCSQFGRLYATGINCSLLDLADLVERGTIQTEDFTSYGLHYKKVKLMEVEDA